MEENEFLKHVVGVFPEDPMKKASKRLEKTSLEQALVDVSPEIVMAVCDLVGMGRYHGSTTENFPPPIKDILSDYSGAREEFVGSLCRRGVMARLMKTIAAKVKMRSGYMDTARYKSSAIYKMRKGVEEFSLSYEDSEVTVLEKEIDRLNAVISRSGYSDDTLEDHELHMADDWDELSDKEKDLIRTYHKKALNSMMEEENRDLFKERN